MEGFFDHFLMSLVSDLVKLMKSSDVRKYNLDRQWSILLDSGKASWVLWDGMLGSQNELRT